MKLLSIVSSNRKNGNTERFVRHIEKEFLQVAKDKNIPVALEQINLGSLNIKFCLGCRICFDKGEALCPLKDELLTIKEKLDEADGLILASPVYVEDINGIMKNWIDRMAFNCYRPAFAGKTAVVITTSGVGSTNHAIKTMSKALQTWGFHFSAKGKFKTGGYIEENQITSRYGDEIKVISNKLFKSINRRKAEKPSFYSLMVFKVQQKYWRKIKSQENNFNYLYWENKGWLKEDCNFYISHNSNYIKIKLAGIIGTIMGIFFT